MAKTIPADEQVFMVSKSTNTTYSGSASLKAMSEWYTMDDVSNTVKPYKVFTALLNQSGGDNPDSFTGNGGTLDKGYTYEIVANPDNYDLTIYGAPNNNAGTSFICTVTVPTLPYTSSLELSVNYGTPVATVLENTIGNVWFAFSGDGQYDVNSINLFTDKKTFILVGSTGDDIYSQTMIGACARLNDNQLRLVSADLNNDFSNDFFKDTPIEIRVYN